MCKQNITPTEDEKKLVERFKKIVETNKTGNSRVGQDSAIKIAYEGIKSYGESINLNKKK